MRNPRRYAGPDRPRDLNRGHARRRSAPAPDGNCRQMPGAPDADVGNPDRDQGGGLADGPRAFMVRDAQLRRAPHHKDLKPRPDLILRSIAKRCASKDESPAVETT